jgi:phosphoglycolate phosphatase-like HAD superfamily hydrolase
MTQLTVFLDVGGVINDKDQQATQWQRLVGSSFVVLLGGSAEGWTRANRLVTERLLELESVQAMANFVSFYWTYQLKWVRGMCALQNMPIPSVEECMDLAYRANTWISRRIRAAVPGAAQAVRLLYSQGYRLHTASGSCSIEVAGYLEGMGVRHYFGRLYGAELINAFKQGPQYYEGIFADAGVRPTEALVVDDSVEALSWATQVGARTILVSTSLHPEQDTIPRIGSLAELPALLQQRS